MSDELKRLLDRIDYEVERGKDDWTTISGMMFGQAVSLNI